MQNALTHHMKSLMRGAVEYLAKSLNANPKRLTGSPSATWDLVFKPIRFLSVLIAVSAAGFTFSSARATELIVNGNLESGSTGWTLSGGTTISTLGSFYHSATHYLWFGDDNSTDVAYQDIAIPSSATAATLSFYYNINTSQTTGSPDTFSVTIRNTGGSILATIGNWSNLNGTTAGSYAQQTYNLLSYAGSTVRIYFISSCTLVGSKTTNFRVDDVSVSVTSNCTYSLSSYSGSPDFSSGSSSFSIYAGSGCSWSASSDSTSWLHTSSSGSGNGTVSYSYDANSSSGSRTGHIMVGGQSFTVTQAGQSADYPGATWTPAADANFGTANRSYSGVRWIIIHTTEGTTASAVQRFQDPTQQASAHYIISRDGSIIQLVHNKDVSYGCGNLSYNNNCINIEHERYSTYDCTPAQYQASANLVKWLLNQYNVSMTFPSVPTGIAPADPTSGSGIIGHIQVPDPNNPNLGGGANHHTDPINWDWSGYETLITGTMPAISLNYGGTTIPNGDTSPSVAKGTDFGTTNYGFQTLPRTFTINNAGNGALNLTGVPRVQFGGNNPSDFGMTVQPSTPVGANGGSTTFQLVFQPTVATGVRSAIVTIANDDPAKNPYTFMVQGTAAPQTRIDPSLEYNGVTITNGDQNPTVAKGTDCGSVNVGSQSATHSFQFYNYGNINMTLTGSIAQLSGANSSDFAIVSMPSSPIAPTQYSTIGIRFQPTGAGLRTASMLIYFDATYGLGATNPYTVALQGTGAAVTKIISLSGNLAFGNVQTGLVAQSTMTIANNGNSTLTVSSISYPSGFSGSWSGTIAAGSSQPVTVTFSPSSPISYSGTVTVNSDMTSGVNTIAASGTGTTPTNTTLPQLTGITKNANGMFLFNLNGTVGSNYLIQSSSDLIHWTAFSTNTIPASGLTNIVDPNPNSAQRFYRVAPFGTNIIFFDKFSGNAIDTNKWTFYGNTVFQTNQTMEVLTIVTDAGGALSSVAFPVNSMGKITITRQAFLHYGNQYFEGQFGIQIGSLPWFSVWYANMSYSDGVSYMPRYGFFLTRNNARPDVIVDAADVNSAFTPLWDTWYNEKVTYDPATGVMEYFMNDISLGTYNADAFPQTNSPTMTLTFTAWGWNTGHEHLFQNLVVSQQTP